MPSYDYLCAGCGPFRLIRSMAESALAQACPACGEAAPRALLFAPAMSSLSTSQRMAAATNERSRHAPKSVGEFQASQATHKPGCRCCVKPSSLMAKPVEQPKQFPSARPWMISH